WGFRATLGAGNCRPRRASAAARTDQRALSSRLHLFARQNPVAKIFCRLDSSNQCGEGKTRRRRLSRVDHGQFRESKSIRRDDTREPQRVYGVYLSDYIDDLNMLVSVIDRFIVAV